MCTWFIVQSAFEMHAAMKCDKMLQIPSHYIEMSVSPLQLPSRLITLVAVGEYCNENLPGERLSFYCLFSKTNQILPAKKMLIGKHFHQTKKQKTIIIIRIIVKVV